MEIVGSVFNVGMSIYYHLLHRLPPICYWHTLQSDILHLPILALVRRI